MKREIIRLLLLLVVGTFLATGCYSHRRVVVRETATVGTPGEVVVVQTAPPAPRTEVIGVAPSPGHVWIQGYWAYRHGRYVWVPGHYELRPRTTATWVPGHWNHTYRGWVWTAGHWE